MYDCCFVIFVDGSLLCGSMFIYDGSFESWCYVGVGVMVVLLCVYGIEVFVDIEIDVFDVWFR